MMSQDVIPLFEPSIIKINNNKYIKSQMYYYKTNYYYKVTLNENNQEKLLGIFERSDDILEMSYNNDKVLIFHSRFDSETKKMCINDILMLYNIQDDIIYACTEEECIEIFDGEFTKENLKSKNKNIFKIKKIKRKITG